MMILRARYAEGVLAEPVGRNTLPAIAWAVARIALQTPDALIGVFSSDHGVADIAAFRNAWQSAETAAEAEGPAELAAMEWSRAVAVTGSGDWWRVIV